VSKAQPKLVAAEALITKKKWVEAMVELKLAEKLDPTNSRVYALMGVVYLGQKAATMAKTCFQKALKLNPKDSIAMKYSGQSGTTTAAKDAKAAQPAPQPAKKEDNKGGLFGFFKK
jgi:Flp pilus assembly protein TadD